MHLVSLCCLRRRNLNESTKLKEMNSSNKLPPNRAFGLFFASLFILLSAYESYWNAELYVIGGWLVASALVAFVAVSAPALLTPLNKAWMKIGDLMGKVVSPLVLGFIFFILITPIAVVTRLFGRDELRLKKRRTTSHWISRLPPGPAADSFNNQF